MGDQAEIKLHPAWLEPLGGEFEQSYMADLKRFLVFERETGKRIFPKASEWFRALDLTPIDDVNVLLLGQDPYHGEGQAHGLCFSVRPGVRPPPSLVNIFLELRNDLGCKVPNNGYLVPWAKQGVLLLNAVLTVRANQPNSHKNKGWEKFTDAVIRKVSDKEDPV